MKHTMYTTTAAGIMLALFISVVLPPVTASANSEPDPA